MTAKDQDRLHAQLSHLEDKDIVKSVEEVEGCLFIQRFHHQVGGMMILDAHCALSSVGQGRDGNSKKGQERREDGDGDGERTEREETSSVERRRKGKENGRVAIPVTRPQPSNLALRSAVRQPRK